MGNSRVTPEDHTNRNMNTNDEEEVANDMEKGPVKKLVDQQITEGWKIHDVAEDKEGCKIEESKGIKHEVISKEVEEKSEGELAETRAEGKVKTQETKNKMLKLKTIIGNLKVCYSRNMQAAMTLT